MLFQGTVAISREWQTQTAHEGNDLDANDEAMTVGKRTLPYSYVVTTRVEKKDLQVTNVARRG